MIDGHKLIISLNDWWYSSFGYEETEESKAIKKVIDEVEKYVEQAEQTDAEIPKNALRSDCTGCRFVGTYDTEFPCANCVRKNKDYYDSKYTERSE